MLPDYVRKSHQSDLSKTSKHWDIFLSHCIGSLLEPIAAMVLQFLGNRSEGSKQEPKEKEAEMNKDKAHGDQRTNTTLRKSARQQYKYPS